MNLSRQERALRPPSCVCAFVRSERAPRAEKRKKIRFEFGIWDFEFPLTEVSGLQSVLGCVNPLFDIFDVNLNAFNVRVFPLAEVM